MDDPGDRLRQAIDAYARRLVAPARASAWEVVLIIVLTAFLLSFALQLWGG